MNMELILHMLDPKKILLDDFGESSDLQFDECDTDLFPLKAYLLKDLLEFAEKFRL